MDIETILAKQQRFMWGQMNFYGRPISMARLRGSLMRPEHPRVAPEVSRHAGPARFWIRGRRASPRGDPPVPAG